jgi:hypothetical protein
VTPPLPEASTFELTSLLAESHPHALAFYDAVGVKGVNLPWKLYRKSSIPKDQWELKMPKWVGAKRSRENEEMVVEAQGDEFRFFDNPNAVLSAIIQDALSHSPACRYLPNINITKITPLVKRLSFNSTSKSSTHVRWTLHSDSHPPIQTNQIIFATGSDFTKQGPTLVPELQYVKDAIHISRGSVIDLESSSPFPPMIMQQNVVIAPLDPPIIDEKGKARYRARLGSTQRVQEEQIDEKCQQMLESAKSSFPGFPSDAVIVNTRSGERAYRRSRLPIVGGLPDPFGSLKLYPNVVHGKVLPKSTPRLSGLYYIGGMGSRGFTLAPLLSKMLVEKISGPFDTRSAFEDTEMTRIYSQWWYRFSPRRVLLQWFRNQKTPSNPPAWNVDWPQLIDRSATFPADYQEAQASFDIIPTSWNPNRTQFESTFCPLFDDDHTRD